MARPKKFDNVEELQLLIEEYFAYCDSQTKTVLTKKGELVVIPHPKPYTVQGLAVYLDCTMETLLQYQKQDAFSETIKKAKTKIETNKVEGMISGDWNATGVIFDLKNNHDWKDKTEVDNNLKGNISLHFNEQQGNDPIND